MRTFAILAAVFIFSAKVFAAAPTTQSIQWQPWSDSVFKQAAKENKFVLMDLQAVWCHWCHVMDDITYQDPEVIRLINSHYIAVKVDQDSRPDLANRYEDYGWPATVVFNARGGEIVKRQGYIPPKPMASMLQAIIDDPTPGPSVKAERVVHLPDASVLTPVLRAELLSRYISAYDPARGGWGTIHKFLDWDSVEYSLYRAASGDAAAKERAVGTLAGAVKLIDPVWGGVYQYSTDGDWDHPHYEKIMQMQAEDLRIYALAHAQLQNPIYVKAAQDIQSYMAGFLLSPDGAFYTSQDADLATDKLGGDYYKLDDASRRKLGIPRIDQHIYSRENGWAICGLLAHYGYDADTESLNEAVSAANWIIANRSLPGGGFSHDAKDAAGPYLGDTLYMGRAFLGLYIATTDRTWLSRADAAATFISAHFISPDIPGAATADIHAAASLSPHAQLDENVAVARFANLLFQFTGKPEHRELAQTTMRYLASRDIALTRGTLVAGILLADAEISSAPLHITIVGPKDNPDSRALFLSALAWPVSYKRLEWYDPAEGPLPHADVDYPRLKRPAAFICTGDSCSSPAYTVDDLQRKLNK